MSEATEQVSEEEEANPYNSRKDWHVEDAPSRGDASGLFLKRRKLRNKLPVNRPLKKMKLLRKKPIIKNDTMI